jgi:hypothetical protein
MAWSLAISFACTHWMPWNLAPDSYHENRKCLYTPWCSLETGISTERKSLKEHLQSDISPTKNRSTMNAQRAWAAFQAGGLSSHQCSITTPQWMKLHNLLPFCPCKLFHMVALLFGCLPERGQGKHNLCYLIMHSGTCTKVEGSEKGSPWT